MKNIFLKMKLITGLIVLGCLILFLGWSLKLSLAQSPDAVAVRIIVNPEHYSALRWYKNKGFTGSPQSLLVDGYEAVRDGRTVYVNAGNVDDEGTLYTNIYLISYNQTAEKETLDIFGEILSRWKFNTNLPTAGNCHASTTASCIVDSNCPLNDYCISGKANVTRDVRRLADLAEIKIRLEEYREKNGRYPLVKSGSYLPHVTISVWPSWQKILAQELSFNLPVDPINKLGDCGDARFNPITCWDENAREFAGTYVPPVSENDLPNFTIPTDSRVYQYIVSPNGLRYNLSLNGEFQPDIISEGDDNVVDSNHAPRFLNSILTGYSGREFIGYIRAIDQDRDELTWSLNTSGTTWDGYGWSAAPVATMISPGNYRLWSATAGRQDNYNIEFTINDGRGESNSSVTRTFIISIRNQPPRITANNIFYTVSSTNPFIYTLTATDDIYTFPLSADLLSPDISVTGYDFPAPTFELSTNNTYYTFRMTGIFAPGPSGSGPPPLRVYPVPGAGVTPVIFRLRVDDVYGAYSERDFIINLRNNRPTILAPIPCDQHVRRGYEYLGCHANAYDQDGHSISNYQFTNLPGNLTFSSANGTVSGTVNYYAVFLNETYHTYSVNVWVTDEYGADSFIQRFPITVDSYCGDGMRQDRNSEQRGGQNDDGYEQCDSGSGPGAPPLYSEYSAIAMNVCDSLTSVDVNGAQIRRQYSCTTLDANNSCPLTGDCTGTCVFTGGYCGDGNRDNPIPGRSFTEACDTGANNSYIDSNNVYQAGGGTCWERDPRNSSSCCVRTYCGDGYIQAPNGNGGTETCDDGGTSNCSSCNCTPVCRVHICGDGYQHTSEECDNGSTANNTNTGSCVHDCRDNVCGDGHLYIGVEDCDDGNNIDGDGCEGDCTGPLIPGCVPCEFNGAGSVFGGGTITGCCFQ